MTTPKSKTELGRIFATQLQKLIDRAHEVSDGHFSVADIQTGTQNQVTQSYIYRLLREKKPPSMYIVWLLADYFGVTPNYFYGIEQEDIQDSPDESLTDLRALAARARASQPDQLGPLLADILDAVIQDRVDSGKT